MLSMAITNKGWMLPLPLPINAGCYPLPFLLTVPYSIYQTEHTDVLYDKLLRKTIMLWGSILGPLVTIDRKDH